ncbi:hypothetical protein GCM10015535_46760 [Streptomyces gelaticus]|uniref:Uncharacterized protein n=1 Tax=Streptomyces gelaticus TaxID=285446 RepID=A0ABQ2W2W1_9ACTN|nr:hypothetical protein GCM10015535_46760 [Streptomyces gelaticus]
MRHRVLDQRDDPGLGDVTCGEIGHDQRAGRVQRLFQGVHLHGPIVTPAANPPRAPAASVSALSEAAGRGTDESGTKGGLTGNPVENIFQM